MRAADGTIADACDAAMFGLPDPRVSVPHRFFRGDTDGLSAVIAGDAASPAQARLP